MGKNHLSAAGPIWKLFLPFLSLERWTCQFLSIYRGKGLSTASEAEKAFREGGFLHSFFLFLCLNFFPPLAVGQPGLSTQEENGSLFQSFLLVLRRALGTTCSLTQFHFLQSAGRAEGGCLRQAKLLLPDPLDFFSATVLHNK